MKQRRLAVIFDEAFNARVNVITWFSLRVK